MESPCLRSFYLALKKQHLPRVLDKLLDLDEESDGLPTIKQTVVVSQGEVHHRSDFNLAVDGDGLVLDGVETEDGGLGKVDDGGAHERAKDATVADGEGSSGHVFNGELVVTGLEKHNEVSTELLGKISSIRLTFFPRLAISLSMPTMSRLSAFLTTGVTRPFSVATATEMST